MDSLLSDSRYFAQVDLTKTSKPNVDWSSGITRANVEATVKAILGSDHPVRPKNEPSTMKKTGFAMYDALSDVLPERSSQSNFFWNRYCRPYASMLEKSNYTLEVQAKFLIFLWARIIGFMGPETGPAQPTMLTQDGSPVEASWVIPTRSKPTEGEVPRSVRFAMEPTDPRNGKFLRGSRVMDYITSPVGGLGIVYCPEGALEWRTIVDKWLYGHIDSSDDLAVQSSGFFLGFGLLSQGYIALKSYFQPPFSSPDAPPSVVNCPMHVGDPDFSPLRSLLTQLDPSLVPPFEVLLEYLASVQPPRRPIFHMMALDVVPSEKNRLKIYVQTRDGMGLSWNDVKRNMTMGGRITGPEIETTMARLEDLWNHLFPATDSSSGKELVMQTMIAEGQLDHSEEHPPGGLGYYYELAPGNLTVMPKIYFPVRHWCKNDKFITDAVEAFYSQKEVGIQGQDQKPSIVAPGWVSREISETFTHRPLEKDTGIATWVTFGHKKKGWELTSYYSPELFKQ